MVPRYPNKLEIVADLLERFRRELSETKRGIDARHPDASRIRGAVASLDRVLSKLEGDRKALSDCLPERLPITKEHWDEVEILDRRGAAFNTDLDCLRSTITLRVQGAGAPTNPLAHPSQVCDAADNLLDSFCNALGVRRTNYVLIDNADRFDPASSSIHLSRARLGVWNLNRAVHEFGHLWAEEFASADNQAQTYFISSFTGDERPKSSDKVFFAKELFADIVATFLTGLAYAYSCLFLDFSPADLRATETHPSGDDRAFCIISTLELLAEDLDGVARSEFERLTQELSQEWGKRQKDAGGHGGAVKREELAKKVEAAFRQLEIDLPGVKYSSLSPAYSVLLAMKGEPAVRPADAGLRDILNGAWLKRLEDGQSQQTAIERMALQMFA